MAAIPTYLYLGDWQINGGNFSTGLRPVAEAPSLWGVYRNWPKFNQSVPSDPSTGLPPGSPAYYPYWDGTFVAASGTSTGATATTITVAPSPGWAVDEWADRTIAITGGVGSGQTRTILSNTADTITVTAAWTTDPTSSTFEVRGAFVVYHYAENTVVAGAKGDNWYELGGGITPCTMLMQLLKEKHGSAPYFKLFKKATDGGYGVGTFPMRPGQSGWTAAMADWAAAVSAMAADGDTPDVQAVILDASSEDIRLANLSYQTHLQETIDEVRATISATCVIVIVNHHPDMMSGTYPASSAFARDINRTIAATNDDVVLVEMNQATFGAAALASYPLEATDPLYYTSEDYIQLGAKLFNAITAWEADAPAAAAGTGIACYVMIGDSQCAGQLNANVAVYGGQGSILGAVGGTVRAGQYIWNNVAREVQLYDVLANPNTFGTISGFMGAEVTLLKRLAETHPDGVVVFKYGKNSASLTTEAEDAGSTGGVFESAANDLLPIVTAGWNDFKAAIIRDLNRVPDVRGIAILLGDNDTLDAPSGASFAATAGNWIDDLRDIFTTRIDEDLAVVWMQPPDHTGNGGQSTHGIATARAAVRATVASLPTAKTRVAALLHDEDRHEIERGVSRVHYGGEAWYNLGYDLADALVELNSDEGGTATATEDSPSGTAAFTVEDGSGLTSSNSYCSVADADEFHAEHGNPSDWIAATTLEKQDFLRRATRELDWRLGRRYAGIKASAEQALLWPREYAVEPSGSYYDSDEVPVPLAQLTAQAALLLLRDESIVPTTRTTAAISSESNSVGEVSRSVTYMGGGKPSATQFPVLDEMAASYGLVEWAGGWGVAGL